MADMADDAFIAELKEAAKWLAESQSLHARDAVAAECYRRPAALLALLDRLEAAERREKAMREALTDVRVAIVEAHRSILTDTLWIPERISPSETAMDRIDAALEASQ